MTQCPWRSTIVEVLLFQVSDIFWFAKNITCTGCNWNLQIFGSCTWTVGRYSELGNQIFFSGSIFSFGYVTWWFVLLEMPLDIGDPKIPSLPKRYMFGWNELIFRVGWWNIDMIYLAENFGLSKLLDIAIGEANMKPNRETEKGLSKALLRRRRPGFGPKHCGFGHANCGLKW